MNKSSLKAFFGSIVFESDSLEFNEKISLLEVIDRCNEHQLMSLLLDGKINPLDSQAKNILEDRFNISKYNLGIQESAILGLAISSTLWFMWRTIQAIKDKAFKVCGTYSISDDRDACVAKVRYLDAKRKIAFYKKLLAQEVPKRTNSEVYRKRVESQIKTEYGIMEDQVAKIDKIKQEWKEKIKKLEQKINKYMDELEECDTKFSLHPDFKDKCKSEIEDKIEVQRLKIVRLRNLIKQYHI